MPDKKTSFTFIHSADLHLGRNISTGDKSSSNIDSRYFRLKDELIKRAFQAPLTALKNLVSVAIENKVDFIVIAGDVFDKHTNSGELYTEFYKMLAELSRNKIRVYITLGNHDRMNYIPGDSDHYQTLKIINFLKEFMSLTIKNQKALKMIYVML